MTIKTTYIFRERKLARVAHTATYQIIWLSGATITIIFIALMIDNDGLSLIDTLLLNTTK